MTAPRRASRQDEGGTMALFLVIAVLGVGLAALLVPVITTQVRETRLVTTRLHALDAAQAGIQVAVGRVRAAADGAVGSTRRLPCGTMSGRVDEEGTAAYRVTVRYFGADPVRVPETPEMTCVEGYGTYDPGSGAATPRYARITSVGTDGDPAGGGTSGRTLEVTYVFRTGSASGGVLRIWPAAGASAPLCMDAGSATPAAGTVVVLRECSTGEDRQRFAYRSDLTLQLVASVTATRPDGLCLDTEGPPAAGNPAVLRTCQPLGSPAYTQQWSFGPTGAFEASLPTSRETGTLSSLCLGVAGQAPAVQVSLAPCDRLPASPTQSWVPAPSAGAGAAGTFTTGAGARQLVNFLELGRCLSVPGRDPGAAHLVDSPCVQNPRPSEVTWDQLFTLPDPAEAGSASGQVSTTSSEDGRQHCLTSPGTDGGHPVLQPCSASDARQRWTVSSGSSSVPFSDRHTVVDSSGRCLGLATVPAETWSRVVVEECTGDSEQKWNAAATLTDAALVDLAEG